MLRHYTGTKTVLAEPMNEYNAVENGYARANEDNHEWREGFHVVYDNPDGTQYHSWSPSDVFNKSYVASETVAERMWIEGQDLYYKQQRLAQFIAGEKFNELDDTMKALIAAQYYAMTQYGILLGDRQERMTGKVPESKAMYTFGVAIELMKAGLPMARDHWTDDRIIIKQVPCTVGKDIIPTMQSLPEKAKEFILDEKASIRYKNQLLEYNWEHGYANSYIPSNEDIFADDWYIAD